MILYVESNFVLELALAQEQCRSCEEILSICETNDATLVLPAFSIAETYETIVRRDRDRGELGRRLEREFAQLLRSEHYSEQVEALRSTTNLLVRSGEEERQRLNATLDRILQIATIIPLERETLASATNAQRQFGLSAQDSIVYASVLQHLTTSALDSRCFLNRNSKDFSDADVVEILSGYHCKILYSFEDGLGYVRSAVSRSKQ